MNTSARQSFPVLLGMESSIASESCYVGICTYLRRYTTLSISLKTHPAQLSQALCQGCVVISSACRPPPGTCNHLAFSHPYETGKGQGRTYPDVCCSRHCHLRNGIIKTGYDINVIPSAQQPPASGLPLAGIPPVCL